MELAQKERFALGLPNISLFLKVMWIE